MNARRALLAAVPGVLALGWRAARADGAGPSHRVSAGQIREAVRQRFPLRYPVAGLFGVDVQAPLLRFLAADNRLGALAAIEVAGPALRRRYPGTLDVDFALRYEPSDLTLRAQGIRLAGLDIAGLPPQVKALVDAYAAELGRQAWSEVVLHTLAPRDLALPDTLGLRPGAITVVEDGLVIAFEPKPAP